MASTGDIRKSFLSFFEANKHDVLPSSSLVPHSDPTLMFTNAGMVPFKNVFSGAEVIKDKKGQAIKRAASSQKCVRAGGKHNDLDNVGYTARHHTFFEMLGNFSFQDYFKDEAIKLAWDLLVKTFELPPEKLTVTIFHDDDEAFNIWKKVSGFNDKKIIRISTSDNFWSMGDTGPCGPCSEIFYDHGEDIKGGLPGSSEAEGDRFVEIWNLVFMQYEQFADGKRKSLPKPCIDTGMGLERITAVLQGVHDNYEIDLFKNLIAASMQASGNDDKKMATSHRVIADHLRSSCFLLADGVLPSNEGRGYVLRRIMRRAMRHAHILGCKDPLMHKLVSALVKEMGGAFPELKKGATSITETLRLEEEKFKETLDKGLKLLETEAGDLKKGGILSGDVAFKLYDTYGFPLDLTEDILRARGVGVDQKGFDEQMSQQKKRARAAWTGSGGAATEEVWFTVRDEVGVTEFLGYETLSASGRITAIIKDGKKVQSASQGDKVAITANQTPFYGESGGQAGDKGVITIDESQVEIYDTKKLLGDMHVHFGKITKGEIKTGSIAHMEVDTGRRDALRANHSATHLLHAALRNVLGDHVMQKGSLVEGDYFRFDFSNNSKIAEDVLQKIEDEVNRIIKQKNEVKTVLMSPDEAVEQGAMALFGEKYGDEVRVVSMGQGEKNNFSVELCGGTHVKNTDDIGLFKITRESSIASGVRRIEAVTGKRAEKYIKEQKKAKEEEEDRKKSSSEEAAKIAALSSGLRESFREEIAHAEEIGEIKFLGRKISGVQPKDLRGFVDDFKEKVKSGVVVIVADNEGKASIVVGVTDDLTGKINAVDLVRKGSEMLGGKGGGGRPDFAQAGGPDASCAEEAIKSIKQLLAG